MMRRVVLALGALAAWLGSVTLGPVGAPTASASASDDLAGDAFAYGVIVDTTDPRSMRMARAGGFSHAKMVVHWPNLEPGPGRYLWRETEQNDLDNVMRAARAEGMRLVVRVDGVPAWAGGAPADADLAAVGRLYEAMAAHARGVVAGYEVLNEPNLPAEWGGRPSAAGYAAFLRAASRGVKRADPAAVVIGGGPSPGTGGLGGTVEDVDFLRGMYAAGARGSFDALGVHPYGGNLEPEADPATCAICFRRAELYRAIMLEAGDAATPVWATEFGWLIDSGTDLGQYDWMKVSRERQADYLVRAHRHARAHWPWLRGALVSNLDASTSPYHAGPQDGMPWFALLDADYAPRPAYGALQAHIRDAGGPALAAATQP